MPGEEGRHRGRQMFLPECISSRDKTVTYIHSACGSWFLCLGRRFLRKVTKLFTSNLIMSYCTTCIALGILCFADFFMSFGVSFLASVAELLGTCRILFLPARRTRYIRIRFEFLFLSYTLRFLLFIRCIVDLLCSRTHL